MNSVKAKNKQFVFDEQALSTFICRRYEVSEDMRQKLAAELNLEEVEKNLMTLGSKVAIYGSYSKPEFLFCPNDIDFRVHTDQVIVISKLQELFKDAEVKRNAVNQFTVKKGTASFDLLVVKEELCHIQHTCFLFGERSSILGYGGLGDKAYPFLLSSEIMVTQHTPTEIWAALQFVREMFPTMKRTFWIIGASFVYTSLKRSAVCQHFGPYCKKSSFFRFMLAVVAYCNYAYTVYFLYRTIEDGEITHLYPIDYLDHSTSEKVMYSAEEIYDYTVTKFKSMYEFNGPYYKHISKRHAETLNEQLKEFLDTMMDKKLIELRPVTRNVYNTFRLLDLADDHPLEPIHKAYVETMRELNTRLVSPPN